MFFAAAWVTASIWFAQNSEDVGNDTVLIPGNPVADVAALYIEAGWDHVEAYELASLVLFGQASTDGGPVECVYYELTTTWCVNGMRYRQRQLVAAPCVEAAGVQICPLLSCPAGQAAVHQTTTSSTGCGSVPGSTCVFVQVGPLLSSSVPVICILLSTAHAGQHFHVVTGSVFL